MHARAMHIILPDGTVTHKPDHPPPELGEMQGIVDGYIELVRVLFAGVPCQMIVNEDGLMHALAFNVVATKVYRNNVLARADMPSPAPRRGHATDAWLAAGAVNLSRVVWAPDTPCIVGPAILFVGYEDHEL